MGWYVARNYFSAGVELGDVVAQKSPPLNIDELVFSDYQGGGLTSRIEVRKLYVRPINFAGFSVKSFNELSLEGVKFFSYQRNESDQKKNSKNGVFSIGNNFSSFFDELTKRRGLGRLVRARINHLKINFLKNKKVYFSIQSERALFKLRDKKRIHFENVIFFRPHNKVKITTEKAYWDEEMHLFVVPEQYRYLSPSAVASGENIAFDLDFKIRHF